VVVVEVVLVVGCIALVECLLVSVSMTSILIYLLN
jgi:hypothetical protein